MGKKKALQAPAPSSILGCARAGTLGWQPKEGYRWDEWALGFPAKGLARPLRYSNR
jgi:hypothetical protein